MIIAYRHAGFTAADYRHGHQEERMVRLWFIGLAAIALQAGCVGSADRPVGKDEAIQIAQNYVKSHFPRTNPRSRSDAQDQGRTWIVRYEPPPGYFGGGPVVTIDKQSGDVIDAYGEQ
jgi:hypothetical protein